MAEIVVEVKTLSVHMKCDKCQNGLMESDGNIVLTSEPPLYPHKCNNCGYMENYPFTRRERQKSNYQVTMWVQ